MRFDFHVITIFRDGADTFFLLSIYWLHEMRIFFLNKKLRTDMLIKQIMEDWNESSIEMSKVNFIYMPRFCGGHEEEMIRIQLWILTEYLQLYDCYNFSSCVWGLDWTVDGTFGCFLFLYIFLMWLNVFDLNPQKKKTKLIFKNLKKFSSLGYMYSMLLVTRI